MVVCVLCNGTGSMLALRVGLAAATALRWAQAVTIACTHGLKTSGTSPDPSPEGEDYPAPDRSVGGGRSRQRAATAGQSTRARLAALVTDDEWDQQW